jgi:hypothetical protein
MDMGHAISDERARKAVAGLRGRGWDKDNAGVDGDVHALMMYVAERLPVETVKARLVNYRLNFGNPGTRQRNDTYAESEIPDLVKSLLHGGVDAITIGPAFDKPIK